ncbi:ferredoxin [Candidatus Gracilibacteria bacterium CG17_big_fil_post_rev_8_21_14_2_50_48_13]|nr:MAG: ferredoxin [Candidatus Gracilibacteria bacterium CG17_big_fil_post_rev_8_21_14_2_50_48_13]
MPTRVDPKICIGCGVCVAICPNSYSLVPGEDGLIVSKESETQPDTETLLKETIEDCPVGAISQISEQTHGTA